MANDKWQKADVTYDLQGRKVSSSSALPKGIYIRNGKKTIIR